MGWLILGIIVLFALLALSGRTNADTKNRTDLKTMQSDVIKKQRLERLERGLKYSEKVHRTGEYIDACLKILPEYDSLIANSFRVFIAEPEKLGFDKLVGSGLPIPADTFHDYIVEKRKSYFEGRVSLINDQLYIFPDTSSTKDDILKYEGRIIPLKGGIPWNKFVSNPKDYFNRYIDSLAPANASEEENDREFAAMNEIDMSPVLENIPIKPFILKKSEILYYRVDGDVKTKTETFSLGRASKPNIKGAAVGGVIAGTAGAIIGSQYNVGPTITTSNTVTTITEDTRLFALYYTRNGVDSSIVMNYTPEILSKFRNLLPDKDIQYARQQTPVTSSSSADELLKFKNLLDQGVISPEEFEQKKKQLLNL